MPYQKQCHIFPPIVDCKGENRLAQEGSGAAGVRATGEKQLYYIRVPAEKGFVDCSVSGFADKLEIPTCYKAQQGLLAAIYVRFQIQQEAFSLRGSSARAIVNNSSRSRSKAL
jgi:hypothetical protein